MVQACGLIGTAAHIIIRLRALRHSSGERGSFPSNYPLSFEYFPSPAKGARIRTSGKGMEKSSRECGGSSFHPGRCPDW